MTPRQRKLHTYLIKICHTLKLNRFPDDEMRKDYLSSRYNKESFKELTIDELKEVAKFLGFNERKRKTSSVTEPKQQFKNAEQKQYATEEQAEIIEKIWFKIANVKTDRALREFIARITKKDYYVLYLRQLKVKEAQKVITALSKMQENWSKKYGSNY
jgi:hypothetical protein